MITRRFTSIFYLGLLLLCLPLTHLFAASESYVQSITGHLKKGDSVTVIDDKFLNMPLVEWNQVKHLSIEDVVSFELRQDTTLNFFTKPFSCKLNVTIKYFTSRDQQSPNEFDNIDLEVKFDTVKGKSYPMMAKYRFKNAFKIIVVVNSISSPEWQDKLPDIFRLKAQIEVERKYPFDKSKTGTMHLGAFVPLTPTSGLLARGPAVQAPAASPDIKVNVGVLPINFNPTSFNNPEEYDIEWTFIDYQSDRGAYLHNLFQTQGNYTMDVNLAAQWMQHDATRVTITSSPYNLNLPYLDGYVLVRIRGAAYPNDPAIRETTNWSYTQEDNSFSVVAISSFNDNLNWQYNGAYAEGGKKKEILSYFDGSLKERQDVTVSNADQFKDANNNYNPTATVQQVVYDAMGRASMSILPAPTTSSSLNFYPQFNRNAAGAEYSYSDFASSACQIAPAAVSTSSGAGMYYSPNNSFLALNNNDASYTKYVPNAQGYPFAVTEYTPDNTGRIRRQGGVGLNLQTGSGAHPTKYYYGKPTQTELERLFGMEAGNSSHYQKNMAVDPNGQASITYIDANGKTVATALAGSVDSTTKPFDTLTDLVSATPFTDLLIHPTDFTVNTAGLNMSASSTFLSEVPNQLCHIIDTITEQALTTYYGAGLVNQLCNNCYYQLVVQVTDECGQKYTLSPSATTVPFSIDDFTCRTTPATKLIDLSFTTAAIGEYTITYTLQLSNAAIKDQTDYYVQTNTDLHTLNYFFDQELASLDLSSCYNTCDACKSLTTLAAFTAKVQQLFPSPQYKLNLQDPAITTWLSTTFQTLQAKCAALTCVTSPCEEKLQQLKLDCLPGGQYALYDPTALAAGNTTNLFLEPSINVMRFYTADAAIAATTFVADDGSTQTIGSLNQADFIHYYQENSGWAAMFVTHHIEYCSYLWCKDASNTTPASNNEVSYTFDATLQQSYQAGQDAVNAGYYNHSDPLALLKKDPWFAVNGRGYAYYSKMSADLQNASTVLQMTPTFGGTALSVKTIIDLDDWLLYCKPTDPNATQTTITNSWTGCSVTSSCRSVTMEWQLYLQYYLQFKKKYYTLAKYAYDPTCVSCFIGSDALTTSGCSINGTVADYHVVIKTTSTTSGHYLVYGDGTQPIPGNYTFSYTNTSTTDGSVSSPAIITSHSGDMQETIDQTSFPVGGAAAYQYTVQLIGMSCTPSTVNACVAAAASNDIYQCPGTSYFQVYVKESSSGIAAASTIASLDPDSVSMQSLSSASSSSSGGGGTPCTTTQQNWYLRCLSSNAFHGATVVVHTYKNTSTLSNGQNVTTTTDLGTSTYYISTNSSEAFVGSYNYVTGDVNSGCTPINYYFTIESVVCDNVSAPNLAPTCTGNSLYAQYQYKTRVFADNFLYQDYVSCNAATIPTAQQGSSQALAAAVQVEIDNLNVAKAGWLSMLKEVNTEEFAGAIDATVINNLVNRLQQLSSVAIQVASVNGDKLGIYSSLPASLPSGYTAPNGDHSFLDAFNALVPTWVAKGFSPDLFTNVYPYGVVPYSADYTAYQLSSDIYTNVQQNLANFTTAAGGAANLNAYLQAQLGDDYLMTPDQLTDLQTRISSGCSYPYLANPTTLPVSFVVPPSMAYITCSTMSGYVAQFANTYPSVTAGTKLYNLLFTNYLNLRLGYALSFADYSSFQAKCSVNSSAYLYDKPETPTVLNDYFSCAANLLKQTYSVAGQEYDDYITQIKIQFRNSYISKCLSNQSAVYISGKKQEYHYTLYYYDQSGDLVKTIPPEGVRLLTDQEIADVEKIPGQTVQACPVMTNWDDNINDIATNMATYINGTTIQAMELWLSSTSVLDHRSATFISNTISGTSNKYVVQVSVKNGQAWVEVYLATLSGSTYTLSLLNQGVGLNPAQLALNSWTNVFINASGGLKTGQMQLYVDGAKMNMVTSNKPADPYAPALTSLPATDTSMARHMRFYSATAADADIVTEYQNSCFTPVSALQPTMQFWGRYNVPRFCNQYNSTQATAIPISNLGSLTVNSNPDTTGAASNYAFTNIVDSFTVEFWVNPSSVEIISMPTYLYGGIKQASTDNIPYAIFPNYTAVSGAANMGVAVGQNGISVIEEAASYMPILMQYTPDSAHRITTWTHVAITYKSNVPVTMYINGSPVTTTKPYTKVAGNPTKISPSYNFGGAAYGSMRGGLDEVRIWSKVRTQAQILASYQKTLDPADNIGLVGYWPMDASNGNIFGDKTCSANNPVFHSPALSWSSTGAQVADYRYTEFSSRFIVPNHGLPTNYAYNSLNAVIKQTSPDGGSSSFFYDNTGRLVASQNAEQLSSALGDRASGRYSYTIYDSLNRIVEVGEKYGAVTMTEYIARDTSKLGPWLRSGTNKFVTLTAYDDIPAWAAVTLAPNYTRKRVTASALLTSGNNGAVNRQAATYYKYDIDGNVAEQVQENTQLINDEKLLVTGATGLKDIQYQYDLISQKVNKVLYQSGKWDQFFYQYVYDDDNRVVSAYSSRSNSGSLANWTLDANYIYYHHGPLARAELGSARVQGMDYAYTLQGWLKGVNGQHLSTDQTSQVDISGDGVTGSVFSGFLKDAFGFSLSYYSGDYAAIGGSSANAFGTAFNPGSTVPATGASLYNGNISSATYAIAPFEYKNVTSAPTGFSGYTYRYDQLNRLTGMDHQTIAPYSGTASWAQDASNLDYREHITYDGNGNIRTYHRNGASTTTQGVNMDKLAYVYNLDANNNLVNNKLRHVYDTVTTSAATTDPQDIINQTNADNYVYDNIGNLKKDIAQNIATIAWTPYGKIDSLKKGDASWINYLYDASGKRISKIYQTSTANTRTHYVYDASGNVLAVYQYKGTSSTTATEGDWLEQHLYGSSRLGTLQPHVAILSTAKLASDAYNSATDQVDQAGNRLYELTNHLGNVMATINDVAITSNRSPLTAIMGANDYYPFGMPMPGRTNVATGSLNYRYGFNGKENDNEVEGTGNQIDYGMRTYDPRVGRFLSVDPLTSKYPWYTPYQFAGNKPIWAIDLDGLEEAPTTNGTAEGQSQSTSKWITGPRGTGYENTITWYWHAGSKDYGTKAGWYNSEGYINVLTPIAKDFAGYQNEYNGVLNADHNWTDDQKAVVANTKLGHFVMGGLSGNAEEYLAAAAQAYANKANYNTTGTTNPSGFNVEDMVGVGLLMKEGIMALSSFAKQGISRTGTVWDDIIATQPNYPGSILPKSFELKTSNGAKVWVHGNATEHIAEFIKTKAVDNLPGSVRLATQMQLTSLQSAVNVATKNGVIYDQIMHVGAWELKFSAPRGTGQLPALIHAATK